jgi:serine/threonine-protein kinase
VWAARRSRSSLINSLEELYRASWLADERELQVAEAQHEHQVAIHHGRGRRGRFSGCMAGTFRLEDVVGRGAMGEVYKGAHLATGQKVAVKIFHGGGGSIQKAPERFLREGEIARGVVATNVVRVLDVGQMTDGVPYIAMEYLEGEDLAGRLRKSGTLEMEAVVDLVHQVALGLEAVHDAGIVHRDLKPQNIFRSETPRGHIWKILDFGVSKMEAAGMTLTENQVVGTPAYMSPEQARGDDLDARSDIFTLSAVVYRCLTGRSPFAAREVPEVLYKIVYHYPPPPRHFAPTINLDVERVLALGLSKNPVHRFQTIGQLARALGDARKGRLSEGMRVRAEALMKLSGWH